MSDQPNAIPQNEGNQPVTGEYVESLLRQLGPVEQVKILDHLWTRLVTVPRPHNEEAPTAQSATAAQHQQDEIMQMFAQLPDQDAQINVLTDLVEATGAPVQTAELLTEMVTPAKTIRQQEEDARYREAWAIAGVLMAHNCLRFPIDPSDSSFNLQKFDSTLGAIAEALALFQ